ASVRDASRIVGGGGVASGNELEAAVSSPVVFRTISRVEPLAVQYAHVGAERSARAENSIAFPNRGRTGGGRDRRRCSCSYRGPSAVDSRVREYRQPSGPY